MEPRPAKMNSLAVGQPPKPSRHTAWTFFINEMIVRRYRHAWRGWNKTSHYVMASNTLQHASIELCSTDVARCHHPDLPLYGQSVGHHTLSEKIAHSTVYLHLSDRWAVIMQLDCWLRWWYTVEWAVSSESVYNATVALKYLYNNLLRRFTTGSIGYSLGVDYYIGPELYSGQRWHTPDTHKRMAILDLPRASSGRQWDDHPRDIWCYSSSDHVMS